MALIIRQILNFHDYALEEWRDPRVDEWFLMSSFWKTAGIIAVYLYFVLNLGPKLMENRKPFNLDKILIIYNVLQVIYCAVLFIMATIYIIPYYNVLCEPCDYSNSFRGIIAAKLTWWYFMLKIIDLLDTVFFVLRKKSNQITFLHVYHHGIVVLTVWTFVRFNPGGSCIYLVYLNSIVHACMYGYYLVTVLFPSHKYHVWWKRYITQLQLVQFVLLFLLSFAILFTKDCSIPAYYPLMMSSQTAFVMYMFIKFYIKTYVMKKEN